MPLLKGNKVSPRVYELAKRQSPRYTLTAEEAKARAEAAYRERAGIVGTPRPFRLIDKVGKDIVKKAKQITFQEFGGRRNK